MSSKSKNRQSEKWFDVRAALGASTRSQVFIFGEIVDDKWLEEEVAPKEFIDAIKPLGDFDLRINSQGGSVTAANAIYNVVRRHKGQVDVYIEGIAASMASVVAMAGNRVIMPANALMMIHDPSTFVGGNSTELRKIADALDKHKVGMVIAYQEKTTMETAEIERMMTDETWMTAAEAVAMGFADEIEAPIQMTACYDLSRYRNVPRALLALPQATKPEPQPKENQTMKCQHCQNELVDGVCTCAGFLAANPPAKTPVAAATPPDENEIRIAERQRINQIDAIARQFPKINGIGDLAVTFRESGGSVSAFQDAVLARMATPQATDVPNPEGGATTMKRAAFDALGSGARAEALKSGVKIVD